MTTKVNKRFLIKGAVIGFGVSLLIIFLSYFLAFGCPMNFGGTQHNTWFCELLFSNPLYSHYPFPKIIKSWLPALIGFTLTGLIIGGIYSKIKNKKTP